MRLKTKFQDEDFELGEVVDATINTTSLVDTHIKLKAKAKRGGEHMFYFSRISELFELFEDYEEPKQWYGLNPLRDVGFEPLEYEGFEDLYKHAKELGIAFGTEEEAEAAVEKLRAWKRLKDKGFGFYGYNFHDILSGVINIKAEFENSSDTQIAKDLDLLFGGEK